MSDRIGALIAIAILALAGSILAVGFAGNGRYQQVIGGSVMHLDTRTGQLGRSGLDVLLEEEIGDREAAQLRDAGFSEAEIEQYRSSK